MPIPVRSIRLQKRSSQSLDTLSGASGEIFFDADRNTLRLYTANQADNITLADRIWVTENTFSGNYNDLTNTPFIPTDVSELSDSGNTLFSGDYNDLTNAPDLVALLEGVDVDITTIDNIGDVDTSSSPLTIGQVLQWDGNNWVAATVSGITDTNTTYDLAATDNTTAGIDLTLTDVDGGQDIINFVGGTGVDVVVNLSGNVEIQNTATYSISDLTDTNISNPSSNDVLAWDGSQWIASSTAGGGGGIELADLSIGAPAAASNDGAISYDNTTGVFTYTPPDLSAYASLAAFSVTVGSAQSAGNLSYNNGTGVFTFNPANLSGYSQLTDFSVTTGAASGGGSLSYNNTSGAFTFSPADLSNLNADLVNDTTPQLGGVLDLNTNDITGTGDINITGAGTYTGAVTADSFVATATGTPTFSSGTDLDLIATDFITLQGGAVAGGVTIDGAFVAMRGGGVAGVEISQDAAAAGDIVINNKNTISDVSVKSQQDILFAAAGRAGPDLAINSTGIVANQPVEFSSFTSFTATVTFNTATSEHMTAISGATSVVTHDLTSSGLFSHTGIVSNFTADFTNVPTTANKAISVALILNQGASAFIPNAVRIDGATQTILWENGFTPSGTANGIDVISFTLMRGASAWTAVLGTATSYS